MRTTSTTNMNEDYVTTLTVPMKGAATDETAKRVIDTSNLSEEDLEDLKKRDAFLYYSIPSVRNATIRRRSSAAADLATQTQRNQEFARSQQTSCTSRVESSSSTMVRRRSSISFECHPDLLLEECMSDTELFGNGNRVDLNAHNNKMLDDQLLLPNSNKQQQ